MSNSAAPLSAHGFVLGFNDATLGLIATAILIFGAVFWSARGSNVEKTDFALTYVGAKIVHDGLGRNLYDIGLQKQLRDSLFQHPSPLFFEHPPFEALLLSPLAGLPFRTAYLIWGMLNAAIWVLLIFCLRPHLPWPREDLGYLSLWLLFAPVGVALYQGQSSLLLLALYALAFLQLKTERDFAAGIALGLGLMKFQFVLPFAFIFLLRRKWRFVSGFLSSLVFLGLLSLIAVGWRGLENYVSFLSKIGNNPQNLSFGSAVDMPTLYGLIYAIVGHRISHTELNSLVALLSAALLGWVAWRWQYTKENSSFDLMFAATVAVSLVCGLHMFTHDFSPLLLPMFLAGAQLSRLRSPAGALSAVRVALAATLLLFWAFPVYFLFVAWHCLYLMCPVLLLFAWSAVQGANYIGRQELVTVQCVAAG